MGKQKVFLVTDHIRVNLCIQDVVLRLCGFMQCPLVFTLNLHDGETFDCFVQGNSLRTKAVSFDYVFSHIFEAAGPPQLSPWLLWTHVLRRLNLNSIGQLRARSDGSLVFDPSIVLDDTRYLCLAAVWYYGLVVDPGRPVLLRLLPLPIWATQLMWVIIYLSENRHLFLEIADVCFGGLLSFVSPGWLAFNRDYSWWEVEAAIFRHQRVDWDILWDGGPVVARTKTLQVHT